MNGKIRILYIDDYELDRELVKDALEKEHGGFEVMEASDRQSFERMLKTHIFDLVLTDFNIAGFEGLQVLEAVQAHDPRLPVIIVTGTGSEEIAVMALKQGVSDYVIKRPAHIRKLPQTIFAAIEKQALKDQRDADELSLKESEEKYRSILENVLVGVYQATVEGKVLFANRKMTEMFGYSASSEELKSIGSIAELYARPEERGPVVEEVLNRGFVHGEYEFRRRDGGRIWVRLHIRKTKNKKGEILLEGLMEDITEFREMETRLQQSQRLEAIGTLAGGIAHDFNNILSAVIGFAELSLDDVEPGSLLHANLFEILNAGNRAKDLVRQIMTFSRKGEQEKKPIQLNPLVLEAVRMLRSTIPSTIEIKEQAGCEMLTINANPSQINQILLNLATNAAHAVGDNGIIEIGMQKVILDESSAGQYPDLSPGSYAKIFVSDNGCGIAQENLDLIFDPYFTTKGPDKGTGLGLAVVHGIVKIHGGHVTVYSEAGKGTTFHIYLPLYGQRAPAVTIRQPEALPVGTERILLVDDEPAIVKMQKQTLERLGYTVAARTSSTEALEAFRKTPGSFDLIITDMTMPGVTGDKLAESAKEIRPGIPVILCTGFSEKVNVKTAKDIMIEGFLMKPVDKSKMAKMIRNVLDAAKNAPGPLSGNSH